MASLKHDASPFAAPVQSRDIHISAASAEETCTASSNSPTSFRPHTHQSPPPPPRPTISTLPISASPPPSETPLDYSPTSPRHYLPMFSRYSSSMESTFTTTPFDEHPRDPPPSAAGGAHPTQDQGTVPAFDHPVLTSLAEEARQKVEEEIPAGTKTGRQGESTSTPQSDPVSMTTWERKAEEDARQKMEGWMTDATKHGFAKILKKIQREVWEDVQRGRKHLEGYR